MFGDFFFQLGLEKTYKTYNDKHKLCIFILIAYFQDLT